MGGEEAIRAAVFLVQRRDGGREGGDERILENADFSFSPKSMNRADDLWTTGVLGGKNREKKNDTRSGSKVRGLKILPDNAHFDSARLADKSDGG